MFLDEALITVSGGNGGDGIVSWRREKFISKGGPDGGDGGNGGNIIFRADANTDTLSLYAQRKEFEAQSGNGGSKVKKHGRTGEDLILSVPPGTQIIDTKTDEILTDLMHTNDQAVIAKGGRGGYGNAHFTSSTRQAPDFAEKGGKGEVKKLKLELKLVADVGIIGLPSTGKSTLISVLSNAKPKIGEYPFTTLRPNLGIASVHDRSIILCDVPGLIEGASEGKGLGDQFLRHIERCGVLVHLLDINRQDLIEDYKTIRNELDAYSPTLGKKRELVVLNKIDLVQNDAQIFVDELKANGIDVFASISAATHAGLDDFISNLLPIVLEERKRNAKMKAHEDDDAVTILQPQLESDRADAFTIEHKDDALIVHGKRIEQIAEMTDWEKSGGCKRFRDICERSGLQKALKRSGADRKSSVFIGEIDVSGKWI